ncbi:MAG TPA: LysM peptidoglycan-binding domain-containing protein [Aestuariivirgaceae bacterium]|nr:LysM peptidoglycan-binding domain-containing protein [Aestuariivirgaceae bacterium]
MYNPLVIFTGAALATLAALMGVTYEKWSGPPMSHEVVANQETTARPSPPASTLQDQAKLSLPEEPAQPPPAKLASITPDEPVSPKSAPTPSAQPEPPIDDSKPTFDTIRIERDGSAVIAGRGLPDSDVTVMLDGEPIGSAKSDAAGAWVFIPDEPVPPGDHQLTLKMQTADAPSVVSEQAVALKVPDRAGAEALVVLTDPNQASKVLQKPEAIPAQETAETTVATAGELPVTGDESAAATSPQATAGDKAAQASTPLTLGTVDYNDKGDIIFSGTARAGSGVRLYVDNKPVGDAAATRDGNWTFAGREEIATGNHSLRVDQLRLDGSVSQRIELPFVRAAPQEVAALNKSPQQEPQAPEAPAAAESSAAEPPPPAQASPAPSMSEAEPPAVIAEADQPQAETEPPAAAPSAMEESTETAAATPPAVVETPPAAQTSELESPTDETYEAAAMPPETPDLGQPRNGKIVIQPGNSLWRISRVIYGHGVEYTVIYEENKAQIRNPHRIYPGQIFATPGVVPPELIDPSSTTPLARTGDTPTSQP